MGTEDDDRRNINLAIERSLGRIEGAQGAINGRLDRIENTMGANNTDAQESRRRLHQLLETHGKEVGQIKERLGVVEARVKSTSDMMSTYAPLAAVSELADAHAKMEASVMELKSAKDKVEGAATGVKNLGRGLWAVVMTLGSFIGGAIVAAVEHFISGPPASPPH